MPKCLELSCLSKPSSRAKSIKFKRSTPGSISHIVFSNRPPNPNRVLDPAHPALHFKPPQFAKAFPWRTYPGFSLRALPKSLLDRPSTPFPDPPFEVAPPRRVTLVKEKARDGDAGGGRSGSGNVGGASEGTTVKWAEGERGRISMSLVDVVAKGVGGRVVRINVLNKFKNAIALVVTRGADVERDADGVERIVFRDEEAGAGWVLGDWTYLCRPDPRLNVAPYTRLIPAVRRALRDVYVPGQQLEDEWSTPSALQMSQLLASLGALAEPVGGPSPNLVAKDAELRKILDELAEHGVTEPDRWEIPPGHTFLETMLERYRELLAGTRAEAAATEASRLSGQSAPARAPSPNHPSRNRLNGRSEQGPHGLADRRSLPGREMIEAGPVSQIPRHHVRSDDRRYPRSRGDDVEYRSHGGSRTSTHHPPHRAIRSRISRDVSSSNHAGPR